MGSMRLDKEGQKKRDKSCQLPTGLLYMDKELV